MLSYHQSIINVLRDVPSKVVCYENIMNCIQRNIISDKLSHLQREINECCDTYVQLYNNSPIKSYSDLHNSGDFQIQSDTIFEVNPLKYIQKRYNLSADLKSKIGFYKLKLPELYFVKLYYPGNSDIFLEKIIHNNIKYHDNILLIHAYNEQILRFINRFPSDWNVVEGNEALNYLTEKIMKRL